VILNCQRHLSATHTSAAGLRVRTRERGGGFHSTGVVCSTGDLPRNAGEGYPRSRARNLRSSESTSAALLFASVTTSPPPLTLTLLGSLLHTCATSRISLSSAVKFVIDFILHPRLHIKYGRTPWQPQQYQLKVIASLWPTRGGNAAASIR